MLLQEPSFDWNSKFSVFEDPNFIFEPIKHEYRYKNEIFTSVTTFIEKFHKPFDSDYWSKVKSEQEGITQEEILARWKAKSDRSCDLGTMVHEYAEYRCAGKPTPEITDPEALERIEKLEVIFDSKLKKMVPVAQELRIFSKKLKLAGTIDGLFEYKNKLVIGDYKTNEKFTTDNDKQYTKLLYPFQEYWENKLNLYSIQVSLYRVMLEECDIKTEAAFLIHISPEEPAQFHIAKDYTGILRDYFSL